MSPPPPPYAPCTRDELATAMDAGPGTESSLDANGWDQRKSSAAARCLGSWSSRAIIPPRPIRRAPSEKACTQPVRHCRQKYYRSFGEHPRTALVARSAICSTALSGQAPKPHSGAPKAWSLTAKARIEQSSICRDAGCQRTLSERLSTRFYNSVASGDVAERGLSRRPRMWTPNRLRSGSALASSVARPFHYKPRDNTTY
jgi:hypothetical protein